jgi:hypothetical protein
MFRNGKWVLAKLPVPVPGARVVDGYHVGIFLRGATAAAVAVNGAADAPPDPAGRDRVVLIGDDGENVPALVNKKLVAAVTVLPAECLDLKPATDRAQLPPARLATVPADWHPSA